MKIKILLVEDEMTLGHVVRERLEANGFLVNWVMDGNRAQLEAKNNVFDIYLLDVMIPGIDGFSLGKHIKKINNSAPIIFLTAKSLPDDIKKGFEIGADDYIRKPFLIEELVYRINAVLKRNQKEKQPVKNKIYTIGEFVFDSLDQTLTFQNKSRQLSYKESHLLALLYENRNTLLNRDFALEKVWGENTYSNSRSMDVFIVKLRNYLKDDSQIQILNVWGKGFKFLIKDE